MYRQQTLLERARAIMFVLLLYIAHQLVAHCTLFLAFPYRKSKVTITPESADQQWWTDVVDAIFRLDLNLPIVIKARLYQHCLRIGVHYPLSTTCQALAELSKISIILIADMLWGDS